MLELAIFLFVILLMLFVGGIVFVHDPKRKANQLFFFWVLLASLWIVTNFLENVSQLDLYTRSLLLKADFAISVVACSILLIFVMEFTGRRSTRAVRVGVFLSGLLTAAMSLSPWMLQEIYLDEAGAIAYTDGVFYSVYGIILLAYFIASVVILYIAQRHAKPPEKGQMLSVMTGLLLTLAVTIPVNFFLQNALPYQFVRIGIYAFLFFVGGTMYAIVRHEFLRIRFVVVELALLGILATILTRAILAADQTDFVLNIASFAVLLVLGFSLVRSVVREIEQRRQLEELTYRLESANAKLKELDGLKTEFLSIASHQLRTPLAVMKGYVEMLTGGMLGKMQKKQVQALNTMKMSNEQLIILVNQLLDLTRIESGRLQVRMESIDLNAVVEWVVAFLKPRAEEKGVDLVYKKTKVAPVHADSDKIKEVIMNLVDNALKYTEKGRVIVAISQEGKWVTVEVKDTGYGLTSQDKQRLFEKFSTGSASKFVKTTSGLGLYVCKKLMQAMDGDIWAESAGKGKGSTFGIRLPKA